MNKPNAKVRGQSGFSLAEVLIALGNYTMGSGTNSGLTIVTGELTTNGGTNFNGLLVVLGKGYVNRNGGGGGAFYGANFIARVDWPAQTPALTSFGAPFFNFNGGGGPIQVQDNG